MSLLRPATWNFALLMVMMFVVAAVCVAVVALRPGPATPAAPGAYTVMFPDGKSWTLTGNGRGTSYTVATRDVQAVLRPGSGATLLIQAGSDTAAYRAVGEWGPGPMIFERQHAVGQWPALIVVEGQP